MPREKIVLPSSWIVAREAASRLGVGTNRIFVWHTCGYYTIKARHFGRHFYCWDEMLKNKLVRQQLEKHLAYLAALEDSDELPERPRPPIPQKFEPEY